MILFFGKKNILIPEGARCCPDHVVDHRLKKDAIDKIAPFSIQNKQLSSTDVQLMINKWQMLFEQQKRFDYDNPLSLSDAKYKIFTGLTKVQFDDLPSYILNSNIRNSSNRFIRTALHICSNTASDTCINYFPNVTVLTITNPFQTSDDPISTTLNRIVSLKQITKLVIEPYDFHLEQLIDLLRPGPTVRRVNGRKRRS